jgi:hypothetical protein
MHAKCEDLSTSLRFGREDAVQGKALCEALVWRKSAGPEGSSGPAMVAENTNATARRDACCSVLCGVLVVVVVIRTLMIVIMVVIVALVWRWWMVVVVTMRTARECEHQGA